MALNNTGNAVGSDSPLDLQDNATVLDELINGTDLTVTGRLGNILTSYAALVMQLQASGGALAYKDATTLQASTPATSNVLAMDTATGTWYFWNGTAWSKSAYQFSAVFNEINKHIQRLFISDHVQAETLNELSDVQTQFPAVSANTAQLVKQVQRLLLSEHVLTGTVSELSGLTGTEADKLKSLMSTSQVAAGLSYLDGFDPESISIVKDESVESTDSEPVYTFPAPGSVIRLDLTSSSQIPAAKDIVVPASLKINIDGAIFDQFCTMEVQGASSAGYAKKNLNLAFYTDEGMDTDLFLKIGDVLPHSEWQFKANWIDCTQVRNTMNYNLWDQMMDTRTGWPKRDIDNYYVGKFGEDGFDTGALAHPRYYPCILYFNGAFYGIGDFGLGKKRQNYNIAKNKPTQIWYSLDDATDIMQVTPTTSSISLKAPSKPTDDTTAAFTAWRTFAQSSQADFTANIGTYMDKNNIIDFYLLIQFLLAVDCTQKNTIITTWDGVKWYFNPYDLDTTYGLHYAGLDIEYPAGTNAWNSKWISSASITFWGKVYTAYQSDIKSRYEQLRNANVFSVSNIASLATELQGKYSPDMISAEKSKWPGQPSWSVTGLDQILTWTETQIKYLDGIYGYQAS